MRDDEKMFQLGLGLMVIAFLVMAVFQVAFRTQERQRARVKSQIVRTQQEHAQKSAELSGLIRPENLRVMVAEMFPRFETIGFRKNINVNDIPIVESRR